ncbi:MAG: methyltransferase domain-containing protein [Gammaproteobacteria bacterium]|nr:methyltransferase domain-containing protein [Gammaproteobacteria bacterium]
MMHNQASYEAWYHTPPGAWIGDTEFSLLQSLLRPKPGARLLDVGCGTGWFSRRFAGHGLQVTGIDSDPKAIAYARSLGGELSWTKASATALPFAVNSFDYCAAITSLCFIDDVHQAVQEMWRVSRYGMVLGLLNRHSLLYCQKHGRGSYSGARWDTRADVKTWAIRLQPAPYMKTAYAIFLPGGGTIARMTEKVLPPCIPYGGFFAVVLNKPVT